MFPLSFNAVNSIYIEFAYVVIVRNHRHDDLLTAK